MIKRIIKILEIDRAIATTLANRFWVLLAGPTTIFFIVRYLSPLEQGYYYTFSSILGLQVFFELGLGFVILQTVSHLSDGLQIEGDSFRSDYKKNGILGRILADILKIYSLIGVLFILIVLVVGFWFLGENSSGKNVSWQLAWFLTVPAFGMTIISNMLASYIEGLGQVKDMALMRLLQSFLSMVALWLALFYGFKLVALAILNFTNVAVAAIWIFKRYRKILVPLLQVRSKKGSFNWKKEIWPFQWRIAISWISGYFGTLAITPIVFSQVGAIEAGKLGLSIAVMNAISGGATTWVSTKSFEFGRLVAGMRFVELWMLFERAERRAIAVAITGAVLFLWILWILEIQELEISKRFLSISLMSMLAMSMVMNVALSTRAIFMRGFRKEPYVFLSLISGFLLSSIAFLGSKHYGINGAVLGYSIVTIIIVIFFGIPVYSKFKNDFIKNE